jgi:hypothetical protein
MKQTLLSFGSKPSVLRSSGVANSAGKKVAPRPKAADKTIQTHLDVGQASIGATTCLKCGMVFHRIEEDVRLHNSRCDGGRPAKNLTPGQAAARLAKTLAGERIAVDGPLSWGSVALGKARSDAASAITAALASQRQEAWIGDDYAIPTSFEDLAARCSGKDARLYWCVHGLGDSATCLAFAVAFPEDRVVAIEKLREPVVSESDEAVALTRASHESPSSSPAVRSRSPSPEAAELKNDDSPSSYITAQTAATVLDLWLLSSAWPGSRNMVSMWAQASGVTDAVSKADVLNVLLNAVMQTAVYGRTLSFDQLLFSFHLKDAAAPEANTVAATVEAVRARHAALRGPYWALLDS